MAERIIAEHRLLAEIPLTPERAADMVERFADHAGFGEHAELTLHFAESGSRRLPKRVEWREAVANHWNRLKRLVCHDYGQDPAPRLEIDLRTGLVAVDLPIEDRPADPGESVEAELAEVLTLTPVGHDLYRYRKTAVTYAAAHWDVARFAKALKTTVENVTGGVEPQLVEAYYTYEHKQRRNVERLRGFFSVEEMVSSLTGFAETDAAAASLRDIELSFEGPAEVTEDGPVGRALGILVRVSNSSVQVTFLSSLTPERLNAVIAPIREAIELGDKPVAARTGGSSASTVEVRTEDRFWVRFMVIPVLAALATTLVSTTVLQALLTDRELRLSTPVENGGEYVMSEPGRLELKWHTRTVDSLWRRRNFDVPATVEVVRDGRIIERSTGRSAATVTLAPGNYVLIIRAESELDPARITVKVVP